MALLDVYSLYKDQFAFYINVENIWKEIAKKVSKKFPQCKWGPALCRDKVISMKNRYEKEKDKNSKAGTSIKDAIFLHRAKLAFQTKENPGKT